MVLIRRVMGIAPDGEGKPEALVVVGIAQQAGRFAVRFTVPDTAPAEAVVVNPQEVPTADEIKVEAGQQIWTARFAVGAHPALGTLRCGPQSLSLLEEQQVCANCRVGFKHAVVGKG